MGHRWLLGLSVGLLLGTGCMRTPTFSTDRRPDFPGKANLIMAFDPRKDVVWITEGWRTIQADFLNPTVRDLLVAKGCRFVPPEEAPLWVNVIAQVPDQRSGGERGQAPDRGGMRGGGKPGGGMRGARSSRGEFRGEAPRRPEEGGARHAMVNLDGEVTLTVQVLNRTDHTPVWTGVVTIPERQKAEPMDRTVTLCVLVTQLLEKHSW